LVAETVTLVLNRDELVNFSEIFSRYDEVCDSHPLREVLLGTPITNGHR
jgi:hypothetical protein